MSVFTKEVDKLKSNYIYCPNCGKRVPNTFRFCPNCNYQLRASIYNSNAPYHNQQSLNFYNHNVDKHSLYHYGSKYEIHGKEYSFSKAFKSFWLHYFDFNGYCSRSEFWWWFLFEYAVNFVLYLLYRTLSPGSKSFISILIHPNEIPQFINNIPNYLLFMIIFSMWGLVLFLPDMSIRIRRLRDVGLPEEWRVAILAMGYFPVIVPIIGTVVSFIARIVMIVLACKPSVRYKQQQSAQHIDTPPL